LSEGFSGVVRGRCSFGEGQRGTQKLDQPAQKQSEVVAGGGKDGIHAVAPRILEIVSAHAVFQLEMADDGLVGGAAPHLASD
jgi:hypothetical protein